LDVFQQRGQGIFLFTRKDEIITLFEERDKVEAILPGRGL
jgi:hypothetical protein